ncbi:Uncharacterised protein [Klebsiella michiganensis]|uniref:Uncharacterized protein n=1 Tax=Klebsiella michiganensis TaxID=1134687 RepID=A0A7H4N8X5_9ENTR|nr:Uncharacterised protein [Klebsiella michiganensis]
MLQKKVFNAIEMAIAAEVLKKRFLFIILSPNKVSENISFYFILTPLKLKNNYNYNYNYNYNAR